MYVASVISGKLAACVNIIPGVSSVYEWEGKINTDSEAGLRIRTGIHFLRIRIQHFRLNSTDPDPGVLMTKI